jgi:hypothetical protein
MILQVLTDMTGRVVKRDFPLGLSIVSMEGA